MGLRSSLGAGREYFTSPLLLPWLELRSLYNCTSLLSMTPPGPLPLIADRSMQDRSHCHCECINYNGHPYKCTNVGINPSIDIRTVVHFDQKKHEYDYTYSYSKAILKLLLSSVYIYNCHKSFMKGISYLSVQTAMPQTQ